MHIRKFTPDGKYLVTFSQNLHAIQLFNFKPGFKSTTDKRERLPNFTDFFSVKYERMLTAGPETLAIDFCLFTRNKHHMILASAVPAGHFDQGNRNPDSLDCIPALDDIKFWVIEIESGNVTDKRQYKADYIYLANHAGVHLYKDYFGVASVQNQCIYIHHVKDSGKLVLELEVGWFNLPDDQLFLDLHNQNHQDIKVDEEVEADTETILTGTTRSRFQYVPTGHEVPSSSSRNRVMDLVLTQMDPEIEQTKPKQLSGMQQRIMSYLYQRAVAQNDPRALSHFYLTFSYFANLILWRMQFLDEDHIMIKYGVLQNIIARVI